MIKINIKIAHFLYSVLIFLLLITIAFLVYRLVTLAGDNKIIQSPYLKVNPKNIMSCQMPFLNAVEDIEEEEKEVEVIETSRGGAASRLLEEPEIFLKCEPELAEEIKIEIAKIKDDLEPIKVTGEGPQIMIYHTHSREAYKQDPAESYEAVEVFRCNDLNYTVVKVGEALARHLEEKGITVLHDRTEHEQGNFNTAYERSLKTIKKRKKEYPSLEIFIDIHRNAYQPGVRNPDDEVVIIDGKRVAKVMAVIGTGEGYLGGFKEKPNWKENYKFALRLTNKLNEKYPGLAKPIYVRRYRFNQHVSTKAILLEIGSNLTTLKEAERTTKYIAEAISEMLEDGEGDK